MIEKYKILAKVISNVRIRRAERTIKFFENLFCEEQLEVKFADKA